MIVVLLAEQVSRKHCEIASLFNRTEHRRRRRRSRRTENNRKVDVETKQRLFHVRLHISIYNVVTLLLVLSSTFWSRFWWLEKCRRLALDWILRLGHRLKRFPATDTRFSTFLQQTDVERKIGSWFDT